MGGLHRRRKRATTTDDYAAMLIRMINAYAKRAGAEPATGLGHLRQIEQALSDAQSVALYTANRDGGTSQNQLAGILRISKQAVAQRIQAGEKITRQRGQAAIPAARVAKPRALPPA